MKGYWRKGRLPDMNEETLGAAAPIPEGFELGPATTVRREIDASAVKVWELISTPGHLTRCHPFCASNDVERWPGVGAIDRIVYFSGLELHREFTHWDEGLGFQLEIGPPGSRTARVVWVLKGLGDDRCALSISVIPYLNSELSEPKKRAYERLVFGQSIERYLQSVVRGIEYCVTTGEKVQAIQFGKHPIYSK